MISLLLPARFLAFFAALVLLAPVLLAAPLDDRLSSAEEIAIAFFKTGDTTPDFDLWAKGNREYKRMPPVRAGDFLDKEKQRLIHLWRDFNPEDDVIGISGNVAVELKAVPAKNGSIQYWMYIILDESELTHFPYKFQDYRFAIIPQKIDSLMIQPIQKEQFENMQTAFGDIGGPARLFLQLKPVKAHVDQPYKIDGTERWALICDIATMSLGSRKNTDTFWNYGADWYISPVTEDLQDLYKAPKETTISPLSTP